MKTLNFAILAASVTAAPALTGTAQRPEGDRMPPPTLIMALDLNRDGNLSTEEIARAPESLAKLDLNEDGQITRDELRPPQPGPREERGDGPRPRGDRENGPGPRRGESRDGSDRPERGPPPHGPNPLFQALDVDRDGVLSAEEIAASWKNLLDLDTDGDGTITQEEIRSARPGGAPKGKGPEKGNRLVRPARQ